MSRPVHPPTRPSTDVLIFMALFLAPIVALAQSTGTVTGTVRDAVSGSPMVSASVKLRDPADSTARILGDLTDAKGAFSIDQIPLGRSWTLEVVYVGYEKHTVEKVTVTAAKPNLSLGEIKLQPGAVEGKEVEVTTERQQVVVKADKTIYNVEDNPSYTATNVSELLGQLPQVEVDEEGKVSLRGEENVTIMMNGRPLTMPVEQRNKFLQSLPSGMVKNIEIRTNPGAQFEAKNQGGIINIVSVKTMSDMFGGNVSGGVDTRVGARTNGGLFYNGGDLNASIGGGYNYDPGEGTNRSIRINYRDTNERRDQGTGTTASENQSYYIYGQVDYKLTEKDLVSLSFNSNRWMNDYTSYGAHSLYNAADQRIGYYRDTTTPDADGGSGGFSSASILLRHDFGQDHKISFDAAYNEHAYNGGNTYDIKYFRADDSFDSLRSSRRTYSNENRNASFITSLDYENPISDTLTLSLGARNEINWIDNNTSVSNRDRMTGEFVPDTVQTNHYLPRNTIYALYGNASYRPIKELSLQAGVRLEAANVSAKYASGSEIISRDYTNLFPSGSIGYNFTDAHSLTLSYRRSIALPDIDALNPTRIKWGDFAEFSGNPDLEPEFSQTMEMSYSAFWESGSSLTVTPYYGTTRGNIERSERLVNGVTYSRSENFNGAYNLGTSMSVGVKPLSWLDLRLSGSVYNKVNRGSDIPGDLPSSGVGYQGNGFVTATLWEGMTLSLSNYFNQQPKVGATKRKGHFHMDVSLRQRLLDNKLTVTLQASDPLNLQGWEFINDSPDFYTLSSGTWTSRRVGLYLNYTFGTTPRMETHRQEKSETKGGGGGGGGSQ